MRQAYFGPRSVRRFLKLHTVIRTNPKVASLPSDADRWHYVLVLVAAKEAAPEGEWLDETYFRSAVAPATWRRLDRFLAAGLLARAADGRLVVPQFADWQASDRELPRNRRDADSDVRIHRQWAEASKRYRARRTTSPSSYDASSQTSKKVSKERHDGSASGANGAPPPACPFCGADTSDGAILGHLRDCDAAARSTTLDRRRES